MVATDPGFSEIRFDLSVDAAQSTAALGDDVTGLTGDTTITFPQSTTSGGTVTIPLTIVDESVDEVGFLEGAETIAFTLAPADTLAPQIDAGAASFTLTIEEDDAPLTVEDSRARPSGGRTVTEGIVTRVEADGAYVQDNTGAFFVFGSDFANSASKGDSVRVDGAVGYFNGLFQVSDVSNGPQTQVLSSGNALPAPQVVSLSDVVNNGEGYESELIRVENFAIAAGGDQTFQGGVPAGLYDISTETASSTLLVTGSSGLVGEPIPDRGTFQGVLGQFNGSGGGGDEPDEGYQLLGIDAGDIENAVTPATVAEARANVGTTFQIDATVTRAFGDFVRIQDDSGPSGASALYIRQTSGAFKDDVQSGTIQPGTQLRVIGTIGEFNGNLQINEGDLASYTVQGQGAVPAPQNVTLQELSSNGEDYEGELVQLAGLEFPSASGSFSGSTSYDVSDPSGTLTFRVQSGSESEVAGEPIPADRFTYTGVVGEYRGSYQLIPIQPSDIDAAQTVASARTAGSETEATVTVTVTRAFGDFARVQDDSGPTGASGFYIRQTGGAFKTDVQEGTIQPGTQLALTGTIGEFNGNLQINEDDLAAYRVLGQGSPPAPQSVTLSDLVSNGEDYEAELVEVTGLTFPSASGDFSNGASYDVSDGSTTFTFRVQGGSETQVGGEPVPSGSFTYTGVVGEFNGTYQLIPIFPSDYQ
jgi:DNA/RNA endonuclease YhcR with UshA esterase domain